MDSATASPASVKPAVEPRLLGELTIVILRARNLQDKSKVGKQSPYAVITYDGDRKRTAAKKKGGQHPEWDEEVRFRIYEDAEDIVRRPVRAPHSSTEPPAATDPWNGTPSRETSGGKTGSSTLPPIPGEVRLPARKSITLQIFADDAKEPKLVGEAIIDLSQVIKSGEHDDWFALGYKGREAGEVSLELTYFINGAPPIPKKIASSSASTVNRHYVAAPGTGGNAGTAAGYGGPGVFSAPGLPGGVASSSPLSVGSATGHRRPYSSASMSSLRPAYGAPATQAGMIGLDAIGEHGVHHYQSGSLSERRGSMNSSVAAPPDFRPGSARPPSGLYSQASLASRLSHSTSIGSSAGGRGANGTFTASPSLEDSLSALSLQGSGSGSTVHDPHGSAPHPHRHSVTGAINPAAWPSSTNGSYSPHAHVEGPPRPMPPPHANSSPAASAPVAPFSTPPPPPRPFSAAFPPSSSFPHLQQQAIATATPPSYPPVNAYATPPIEQPQPNTYPYQDQQPPPPPPPAWPFYNASQYPDQTSSITSPPAPAAPSYPALPTVPPHLRKPAAAPSSPSNALYTPPRPVTPSTGGGHYPTPTSSFHRNDDSLVVVQSGYQAVPSPMPNPVSFHNGYSEASPPPQAPMVPPRPHSAASFQQEPRQDWQQQPQYAQDANGWQATQYGQGRGAPNGYQAPPQQQQWQPTHTHSHSAGSAYLRSLPIGGGGPTYDARAPSPAAPQQPYYDQTNYAPSWQSPPPPPPPPPGDMSYQPRPPSPLPPPRVSSPAYR